MNLNSPVGDLALVGPVYAKRLDKLGIKTVGDLLNHVPSRYLDYTKTTKIAQLAIDDIVTVKATIKSFINRKTKRGVRMQLAQLEDETGTINAIWFNQPYLIGILRKGVGVSLSGKVGWFVREKALLSPDYELEGGTSLHTGRLVPIYPETRGVSSKWLRSKIRKALDTSTINDFLARKILSEHKLIDLEKAYEQSHFPKNETKAKEGIRRLAFDEMLMLHISTLKKKALWEKHKLESRIKVDQKKLKGFISSLPFTLTASQRRSIHEILGDLSGSKPMNRLLEGDVGSGKTVVAAACAYIVSTNNKQSVFMAPTQILANQHYKTLQQVFAKFDLNISLVTSDTTKGDPQKADIVVGTHALIHKKFNLEKKGTVALVVIDEQQRFGVKQRSHLVRKSGKESKAPHVLTMTATPIPRTVALTFHGDLDLSTLDELPKGRQKITTWVVPERKRHDAYNWIKEQIKAKSAQVYVVCPLIEESDKESMVQVKSVKVEYEKLKKVFPHLQIEILHGKIKGEDKEKILTKFKSGKIDILVSTPVVEVGIDATNATIMVVETAERFGLSQLHQLRGRVGRGDKKSYCLLFAEKPSQVAKKRLSALKSTMSGFDLAELDLKLRGPGEIFGTAQSGFPELKIASWSDRNLIKSTKKLANKFVSNPSSLPKLSRWLNSIGTGVS